MSDLSDGRKTKTYGVEIDEQRAGQANQHLDHALHCSIDEARITNGCFSLLWLNPPYDTEDIEPEAGKRTERKERAFLRDCVRYLQPGGVLVYIIPQARLDVHVAGILAYRFQDIRVYRFPGDLYGDYRQIIVLAKKKPSPDADPVTQRALARVAKTKLPELRQAATQLYELPPTKPISLFKGIKFDRDEMERQVKRSPLWDRLYDIHRNDNGDLDQPPIPLHKGHIALLLASGSCDGVIGAGEQRHLVKGHVRKTKKVTTEHQERGEQVVVVTKQRDQFNVVVRLLTPDGTLLTLR